MREGIIVALCTSLYDGLMKSPQDRVMISPFGFAGDRHAVPERRSFKEPGVMKPNTDRHITILAQEVLDEANRTLNLKLVPGNLGENITAYGLGDLSNIEPGTPILLGEESGDGKDIILRVSAQNQPCKKLLPVHRLLPKMIQGRRGLLCTVEKGAYLILQRGAHIHIL
jgi:MOSC domain-containing protein YiiM